MGINVSKKILQAVDKILQYDGKEGISCKSEYDQLSGLLAGTKGKQNQEYIQGFMIEWENKEAVAENTVPEPEPTPTQKPLPDPEPENVQKEEDVEVPKEKEVPKEPPRKPVNKKPINKTEKRSVDNNRIVNDNDLYQGGKNNINVGPGGHVIINPQPPVNFVGGWGEEVQSDQPNSIVDADFDVPVGKNRLSNEEIKEARSNGHDVAEMLIGYTNESNQRLVNDILNNEVDSRNVMEFLRGYAGNVAWGDKLFEQLRTEYGFEEAQNLMRKVATDLSEYYKDNGEFAKAKEIDIILLENGFDKKDAQALDKLSEQDYRLQEKTDKIKTAAGFGLVAPGIIPIVAKNILED